MQIATTLHCLCMHADSCVKAHVGQAWAQTFNHMCSVTHTTHYSWSSKHETCIPAHNSLVLSILLLLSRGSLHSACAPSPQTGGWRTLQRWSGHLDFSLAVATEDLCSPWIPWPQEGADAQNTTLLCYTQSGQPEEKEQQIVARDFLLLHHYFLSKDDLKTLDVTPG